MRGHDFADFRLREAVRPSLSPVLRGLGQGATPIFRDFTGAAITSIECGQAYTFDVPGYSQVRLQLIKNGLVSFDAPFDVPMPAYASVCATDVGHYDVIAYDVQTDVEIGRTTFDILAAPGSGAGSITSWFSGLSTTSWLMIGGAALLLLKPKRKSA